MDAAAERRRSRPLLLLAYANVDQGASLIQSLSGDGQEIISCPLSGPLDHLLDDMQPALVLLAPPSEDGQLLETCELMRNKTARPIVVLSGNREEMVITRALAAGVDEYLTLPLGDRELAARVQAMLRRLNQSVGRPEASGLGDLILSSSDLSVAYRGHRVFLSPMEFRLLSCLASEPGKVFTHDALMSRVWGEEYVDSRQYLHLYIRYLREKLEDDPHEPRLIVNEWGIGYRLQPLERSAD